MPQGSDNQKNCFVLSKLESVAEKCPYTKGDFRAHS